jgi:two-component sensor histidine kinase
MANYLECAVGSATAGNDMEIGRSAARMALSRIKRFEPSLAIAFVSAVQDVHEVTRGIRDILGDCPLIGTSSAGNIATRYQPKGIVLGLIASPHIKIHLGMGRSVSENYKAATDQALAEGGIQKYFNPHEPLHQMLHVSADRTTGVSPVFMITFSPGPTGDQVSPAHVIHTYLRQSSANRIPIFGGTSADFFSYEANYQILNDQVLKDALAVAFIESELLFGIGLSHGYAPTTKRALVTKSVEQVVIELDGRPAADVYADFVGIPVEDLMERHKRGAYPSSTTPFGSIDIYGNSILHVPERILPDKSIQFPNLIRDNRVVTLMQPDPDEVFKAGWTSFNNAIQYGGLSKPSFAIMCACALRLTDTQEQEEIVYFRNKSNIPLCGFYSFGENSVFNDGLPVYSNCSVSTLVLSDELNPIASLIRRGKRIYNEFEVQINHRASQLKALSRISQKIQDANNAKDLLHAASTEFKHLFPWAHWAIYQLSDKPDTQKLVICSTKKHFAKYRTANALYKQMDAYAIESQSSNLGFLILEEIEEKSPPSEDDRILIQPVIKMMANGLLRFHLDNEMKVKLQQLDILSQLSHQLSKPDSFNAQNQQMLEHIRGILKFTFASLWIVDPAHNLLIKEALVNADNFKPGKLEIENDERLAKWQLEHQRPIVRTAFEARGHIDDLSHPFDYSFVSLPFFFKDHLRGTLNLYSTREFRWASQREKVLLNVDFLQSISSQIAIFVENRTYQQHATLYREIHHRVKNNLQNIASLLRMQRRRLDHAAAKQALTDSISRIMSIALVHETLSSREIGLVEIGHLVGSISKFPYPEASDQPIVTLDISGPEIFISSKEATALALVANELIQNAYEHGVKHQRDGRIAIKLDRLEDFIQMEVCDNGPGLKDSFDWSRDGNLGMTIVKTLVKDELKGEFEIENTDYTTARVKFPANQPYYQIGQEAL